MAERCAVEPRIKVNPNLFVQLGMNDGGSSDLQSRLLLRLR